MRNPFRRQPPASDTLAALCPSARGVAAARVRRLPELPPSLELCTYAPVRAESELPAAMAQMVRLHHLDRVPGTSVMAPGSYGLYQVEAPDVPDDEMSAAIRWRLKDSVDADLGNATIETFEVPTENPRGTAKRVFAVVANSALVRARIDALLKAGLKLEYLDIPELVLLNVAALVPEDVTGVVLLHMGEDSGVIIISRRGVLYLCRSLSFGTNALPATPVHQDDEQALFGWLDSIIIEIQRSIDFYEANYSQPRVRGLVLTPMNRTMTGATEYLDGQLGLSSRILDFNALIDGNEPLGPELQANCALAIGAALRQPPPADAEGHKWQME